MSAKEQAEPLFKAEMTAGGENTGQNTPPGNEAEERSGFEEHADSGKEATLDPDNFKVCQGRSNPNPNRGKVKALVDAIKNGDRIPLVRVYEDAANGERCSPDGAHRQAAYKELKWSVPVIIVKTGDARERAETESCRANHDNGRDRSKADELHQAKKAFDRLKAQANGAIPNPNQLSAVTQISHPRCVKIIRDILTAGKLAPPVAPRGESEFDDKLNKALTILQGVNPKEEWAAGEDTLCILTRIRREVARLAAKKPKEPEIKVNSINNFIDAKRLSRDEFGRLVNVKGKTVTRWLNGVTGIPETRQCAIRTVLSLDQAEINAILERNGNA
jgi:hypothetical protein